MPEQISMDGLRHIVPARRLCTLALKLRRLRHEVGEFVGSVGWQVGGWLVDWLVDWLVG